MESPSGDYHGLFASLQLVHCLSKEAVKRIQLRVTRCVTKMLAGEGVDQCTVVIIVPGCI